MTLRVDTGSEAETISLGARIGALARPGDCVALSGDLGAGKTRLVRGVAQGMGIDPARVHSPTFVLANVYRPGPPARGTSSAPSLIHVDAHRLHTLYELDSMGLDGVRGLAVTVIEWADRVSASLPADRLDVRIEHLGEHARAVTIEAVGESWRARLAALRSSA